jgi:2-polyprenyl-6-methoxyphenol hydroxylase-like FAD-dependent oxidoreductase
VRADAPLRAVVIGAGLAGLATAKALCGLFDEVTLLERDDVAAAPASAEDATQDQVQLQERGDGASNDRLQRTPQCPPPSNGAVRSSFSGAHARTCAMQHGHVK